MASLALQSIHKSYGDVQVLQDIQLDIADGEFVVLVGPSGCGKSTLLRCVAGLERISEGALFIGERRVDELPPKDRDVAMVFQSYALYPHMTVAQNLSFALEIRKRPRGEIEELVQKVAEMLDIAHLLKRLPGELSGGQRQRVAIGRAIVRTPQVFLFDEPLSNLDAELRGRMRVELKLLHQRLKSTMIYVTHDQVEAMTLADRIVVLEGGHIQQVGSPRALYEQPQNRFVAGFIGSPPMNFLQGSGDGQRVEASGLSVESAIQGPVELGVRPQDFILLEEGGASAVIEVVERLGWELHLHVLLGEERILVQVEAGELPDAQPGQRIQLGVQTHHLFDCDTGARRSP